MEGRTEEVGVVAEDRVGDGRAAECEGEEGRGEVMVAILRHLEVEYDWRWQRQPR
jgi:hypothetical protein